MSPVTAAGTVTQILAEALAGIAFTQLMSSRRAGHLWHLSRRLCLWPLAHRPLVPLSQAMVIYAAAALARRLGVPFRSGGGLSGSKLPDAQAAYEAANTLADRCPGRRYILCCTPPVGSKGGLAMGYEKFIMDCDQASMIGCAARVAWICPRTVRPSMLSVKWVPGKHYLGSEPTP